MNKKNLTQEETINLIALKNKISKIEAAKWYKAVFGTLKDVLEAREYKLVKTPIGTIAQHNISKKKIILNGVSYKTNKKTYKIIPTPKIVKKETIKLEEVTNGQDKE